MQTILVPLDGSALAEQALTVAEALAQRTAGQLLLVRAVPLLSRPAGDAPFPTLAAARAAAVAEAWDYLKSLISRLEGRGISASATVSDEDEALGIVAVAHRSNVDLIVMATHGRSGLGRWVYGSVAEQVLAEAPVPIVLVRAWQHEPIIAAPDKTAPILVPLDGSPVAEAALPMAAKVATELGSMLLLVRAIPRPGAVFESLQPAELARSEAVAREYLTTVAKRFAVGGQEVQTAVRTGSPEVVIEMVGREHGVGIIVMSTHGFTGLRRIALGSVADAVVRQGSLPVMLVRPPATED